MDNFERENKRLKVLIVILLVFLVAFGGYYFYINVIKGNNKNTADDKETINDIITSDDDNVIYKQENKLEPISTIPYDIKNFTDIANGKWINCTSYDNDKSCQSGSVININDDNIDIYYINSEGLISDGKILSVSKIKDNMYSIIGIMENRSDHVNYDYDNKNIIFSLIFTKKEDILVLNEYKNLSLYYYDRELGNIEYKLEK